MRIKKVECGRQGSLCSRRQKAGLALLEKAEGRRQKAEGRGQRVEGRRQGMKVGYFSLQVGGAYCG